MVKITFEVSEDFIRENANPVSLAEKMKAAEGNKAMKVLFDAISFGQLKKQVEEGKTEFVVPPDKLDKNSMDLYNKVIGEICFLAASSETDKKEEE